MTPTTNRQAPAPTTPTAKPEPSKLWRAISGETTRPTKLVDFPREDENGLVPGRVRMRVLTQNEQMICATAAHGVARKHLKEAEPGELGYERLYSDALMIEVLFRACRDEHDPNGFAFPTPLDMRAKLTTVECSRLLKAYLTAERELSPVDLDEPINDYDHDDE